MQDSARMRRRIAALVGTFPDLKDVDRAVPQELGINVPYSGMGYVAWAQFFADCALKDVLDFVTIAVRHLHEKRRIEREPWSREVQRIFEEENVHYQVDQWGGVSPSLRAATCASLVLDSARAGLAGLTTSAMTVAVGTNSCSSSSCFGTSSTFNEVTPVILPPGRLRLATSPSWTGSSAIWKTVGIVVVAALAASAAGWPVSAITLTGR